MVLDNILFIALHLPNFSTYAQLYVAQLCRGYVLLCFAFAMITLEEIDDKVSRYFSITPLGKSYHQSYGEIKNRFILHGFSYPKWWKEANIKISEKQPDREHPYGHERMECVASIILSVALAITGAPLLLKHNFPNLCFSSIVTTMVYHFVNAFFENVSRKSFQDSTIRFLSLVESHLRRQSYPLL